MRVGTRSPCYEWGLGGVGTGAYAQRPSPHLETNGGDPRCTGTYARCAAQCVHVWYKIHIS